MTNWEIRTTNDENGIVVWIDKNGLKCIMQPHLPGETEGWKSEAEAIAWAEKEVASLVASEQAAIAAEERKKELEDAQLAAAKAQVDTANALAAILAKMNQ